MRRTRNASWRWSGLAALIIGLLATARGGASLQARALPGLGELNGRVVAPASAGHLTVYAFNVDKHVGYMVYVVRGRYRITNLFPGHYDVTLRGTVGQRNWSLPQQTSKTDISGEQRAAVDFRLAESAIPPTYVGGMTYPDARVEPYDRIYPPGRGRDVIEHVCFGCHTVSFYPYNVIRAYPGGRNQYDRDGWALTVDRMASGASFGAAGKPSYFDHALLPPQDRDAVVDYLAANFGPASVPRAVRQDSDPKLDDAVLARAEFVEYRFLNTPGDEEERYTHTPDFDGQGNVWIMDRGGSSLVKVDPRTAEVTDHKGQGGGEFLAVDVDGTIWYGGLSHFDPVSQRRDDYRFEGGKSGRGIGVSSLVIDSKGDIWLSLLTTGGLAKFDRKENTVVWWDVPVLRSRPYGITLDHDDNVWFAEYHNSGIGKFDPRTRTFRHYPLTVRAPTNIRRLSVDSRNLVWSATWGSPGLQSAAVYRVDPATGELTEYKLGIPYANPYDTEVDAHDDVWVATDNHVLRLDPRTGAFTRYPAPERTDIPKLAVTRDGAVWFGPRNAGHSGSYGGAATVLYPDKDRIESFAAYYSSDNARYRKASYHGPATPVTGSLKLVPAAPQNPGEYAQALGLGPSCSETPASGASAPSTIKGGAARE